VFALLILKVQQHVSQEYSILIHFSDDIHVWVVANIYCLQNVSLVTFMESMITQLAILLW